MSMVFNWRVMDGSWICLSATPLIGEMPSFIPAFSECLQVLRSSRAPPGRYKVTITRGGNSRAGWLDLYPFNAFPRPVINQYLSQVRVLYGGAIPTWNLPGA
jgi:hypothetical protein